MVRLVALLQPAQDRDRVGDGRLADEHGLEAPLEGRILLDVLAVLVERRRADGAQLSAREHRLEQVSGRDGALGRAGADDRVQLVDEEDDLALRGGDLREHRLEPLLELAPVLGARDQRPDVERPDALALQSLGHVARDDALGEALGDRRLADARLADQDGIVLRPAREHLDRAPDLLVAADHGVELSRLGGGGEVAAELRQRLVGALGILRRHPLAAAHVLERAEQLLTRDELEREHEMLDRDEVVVELARLRRRRRRAPSGTSRPPAAAALPPETEGSARRRASASARIELGSAPARGQQRSRQLLLEERHRQVVARQLRVAGAPRQLLGAGDCLAGLDRQLVEIHAFSFSGGTSRPSVRYRVLVGSGGR